MRYYSINGLILAPSWPIVRLLQYDELLLYRLLVQAHVDFVCGEGDNRMPRAK